MMKLPHQLSSELNAVLKFTRSVCHRICIVLVLSAERVSGLCTRADVEEFPPPRSIVRLISTIKTIPPWTKVVAVTLWSLFKIQGKECMNTRTHPPKYEGKGGKVHPLRYRSSLKSCFLISEKIVVGRFVIFCKNKSAALSLSLSLSRMLLLMMNDDRMKDHEQCSASMV